jgi:Fe2+ transport system protein FeoA
MPVNSAPHRSDADSVSSIPLADLRSGEAAHVTGIDAHAALGSGHADAALLIGRLRDLGFVTGAQCEVLARMWLGGDPLVVRIAGSTFALRRLEAAAVRVRRIAQRESVAGLGNAGAALVRTRA